MQRGEIKPGPKTLAKLSRFKERYQYGQLRAAGITITKAKKLSRGDYNTALKEAAKAMKIGKRVAKALSAVQGRKINYEWILYHIYHSDRDIEDWDMYALLLVA
jgi:hypothetical protein